MANALTTLCLSILVIITAMLFAIMIYTLVITIYTIYQKLKELRRK